MRHTAALILAMAPFVAGTTSAQSNNYTAQEQQNLMVVQGFWNDVFWDAARRIPPGGRGGE